MRMLSPRVPVPLQVLLKHGAKKDIRDADGKTPGDLFPQARPPAPNTAPALGAAVNSDE